MQQVFVNLISNAIKFTREREKARIEIGYRMDGTTLVCFVKDNGVGFNMKYMNKLFGVFQRLHSAPISSKARAWACRSCAGSSNATAARSGWTASRTRAPRSTSACRIAEALLDTLNGTLRPLTACTRGAVLADTRLHG